MDPEEEVLSTGQDQGSKRGGRPRPTYREPGITVLGDSFRHRRRCCRSLLLTVVKWQQESSPPEPKQVKVAHFTGSDQKTNRGQGVLSKGRRVMS